MDPQTAASYHNAVAIARQGQLVPALQTLAKIYAQNPMDVHLIRDYAVVSGWAGRDQDVITLYERLPEGEAEPEYVLEAAAHAYRDLGNDQAAFDLYQQGLEQSPGNAPLTAGLIRTLTDLKQPAKAIEQANNDLAVHGERVPILLAAAYAEDHTETFVEELRYCERALKVAPNDPEVRHDYAEALDRMGAPELALNYANQNPNILPPAEYRRIEGDVAAQTVRWGELNPPSEKERFAETDRAIAMLDDEIARWSQEGPAAASAVVRARLDRIVAYRDRVRMQDVLSEYKSLEQQGVIMPPYVTEAAADADMYVRDPEDARKLYHEVLAADPNNFNARMGLFYADVDLEDFDDAYQEIDAADNRENIWRHLKGLAYPLPNPDRGTTDMAVGKARMYAGQLADANDMLGPLLQEAPNNADYRDAIGDLDQARGWPRAAAEQYDIGNAISDNKVPALLTGKASTDLTLQKYPETEAQVTDLDQRFPENQDVQRLDRAWQVHNMAELRISAQGDIASQTNVQGGSGFGIDAQLYSPPIDYNWRLFGGQYFAEESLPTPASGEGSLFQPDAGIEYREDNITADLALTENFYHDTSQPGGRADVTWTINDLWTLAATGEILARDTPLRALNAGTTADSFALAATYRTSESQQFKVSGDIMPFSDGNVRSGIGGQYTQRLWTIPHFTIDGIVGLAESQNSENENRPYYNPSHDALADAGLDFTQLLYRRYDYSWDHHLLVLPGVYWESSFGAGPAVSLLYEQRLHVSDTLEFGAGIGYGYQPYDGVDESTVTLLLDMIWRFAP